MCNFFLEDAKHALILFHVFIMRLNNRNFDILNNYKTSKTVFFNTNGTKGDNALNKNFSRKIL
jgi:hypothetical protein